VVTCSVCIVVCLALAETVILTLNWRPVGIDLFLVNHFHLLVALCPDLVYCIVALVLVFRSFEL